MDWSKAKNILIVAFIITNIFLIYNIEKNMSYSNSLSKIDEEHIQTAKEILKEKNIYIHAQIPTKILKMPVLNVAYENWDRYRIQEAIRLNPYRQAPIMDMSPQKARQEAEKFISKNGFMKKDVVYWDTQRQANGYRVIFKQKYKDKFLEYSYMTCIVTPLGVTSFDRTWLKPLKIGENKKEIIPATKALLKLMKDIEEIQKPIVIRNISLGYWFDPARMGFENAESGRAVPAWRFVLDNGETIFIDAYKD